MSKYARTRAPFIRAGFQRALQYKVNFFFNAANMTLASFILLLVWRAVYSSSSTGVFGGFTMEDATVYVFVTLYTTLITATSADYAISSDVREGIVAMRLIQPISFEVSYKYSEIGEKISTLALVLLGAAGLEIYRFAHAGAVQLNPWSFCAYLLSAVFAYMVSFYFSLCFGFCSFLTKYMFGLVMAKTCVVNFLSGALVPLAFLPPALAAAIGALPFASIVYTPAMIYMGRFTPAETAARLAAQLVWAVFFYGLAKAIWAFVRKRVTVQGG